MSDHIRVQGLSLTASLSESPWTTVDPSKKPVFQPIIVGLDIHHDIKAAGSSDDLTKSISYSDVCKSAQSACLTVSPQFSGPGSPAKAVTAFELAERIIEHCLSGITLPILQLDVELELPKATLRAKSACVKISRFRNGSPAEKHRFLIKDLPVHTIVGIHPHERQDKQPVIINVEFSHAMDLDENFKFDFARLERCLSDVRAVAIHSSFFRVYARAHLSFSLLKLLHT